MSDDLADFCLGATLVAGAVVDDHRDRADVVVEGGFEHPSAQGLNELTVGAFQETSPGRVPLDLLARRDAEVGGDTREILGERG
jgi:hypothetical protein